jgi:hypothetical protein
MNDIDRSIGVRTYANDAIHLVRTVQTIQYQLSQMADQKANMVLAASFVIFTVTLSQAKAGVSSLPLPLLVLGACAFAAAFLAILAVLPSVTAPPKATGVKNVLFFNAFTQIPEQEFVDMILGIMAQPQTMYEAMAHDIYQNGQVLAHKKYRFLGYAYRILLTGLVASFVTFMIPFVAVALRP